MSQQSYADRAFIAFMKCRGLDAFALKALRTANHLLGLAIGARLAEMRENGEPFLTAASNGEELSVLLQLSQERSEILAARLSKIPNVHRPHYTPEQRYRILRIKDVLALSRRETARRFCIDDRTIARWQADSTVDPAKTTIGSLVKPVPPVRRYADVVRGMVQTMALLNFGGHEQIAFTLARAGWRISKRTIGRIRKERAVPAPSPPTCPSPRAESKARVVRAKRPHHVLMMDITEIPALFRIAVLKLVLVVDVFSRMPLASKVTLGEPSAEVVTEVFRAALCRHGAPPHLVTDQGSQFPASIFTDAVKAVDCKQRFGAIGHVGSIALIERLWRTLKLLIRVRSHPPLTLEECQKRVDLTLLHYAYLRPHSALRGATPAEVYFRIRPAHEAALHPPRGKPREDVGEAPFEVVYLDEDRRLPFLLEKAA